MRVTITGSTTPNPLKRKPQNIKSLQDSWHRCDMTLRWRAPFDRSSRKEIRRIAI